MEFNEFFENNIPGHHGLPWQLILGSLLIENKEALYAVLYKAISKHPSYVVLSDLPVDRKMNIIEEMLIHFELKEDYEKCANLLKLKKELELC
jgi:hypothetical protein